MPPPLLRILWRLGIRLPPLPLYAVLAGRGADGGFMGHFPRDVQCGLSTGGPSGMVAGEAIIISITGGFFVRTAHGLFPLVAQES